VCEGDEISGNDERVCTGVCESHTGKVDTGQGMRGTAVP